MPAGKQLKDSVIPSFISGIEPRQAGPAKQRANLYPQWQCHPIASELLTLPHCQGAPINEHHPRGIWTHDDGHTLEAARHSCQAVEKAFHLPATAILQTCLTFAPTGLPNSSPRLDKEAKDWNGNQKVLSKIISARETSSSRRHPLSKHYSLHR